MARKRVALSTGGGDCPGLNAVIRAVVKTGISQYGWECVGIRDGFDGLLGDAEGVVPLGLDDIRQIISHGGTILGTTNRGNPFKYTTKVDGKVELRDRSDELMANYRKLGLDALVVIGGDGTLGIAHQLTPKGANVVGVPKTIDNDLCSTDLTFGFDSAVTTATEAVDKLKTTGESHHRVMVMEVMGRDAGWIALYAGLAGGANVILLPEIPFDIGKVAEFVHVRSERGKYSTIVVVSEGAKPSGGEASYLEKDDARAVARLGGIGNLVGAEISRRTDLETRVTVLGHIQRGGSPTSFDRVLSTRFGVAAARLIHEERYDHMVSLRGGEIVATPLSEVVKGTKTVPIDGELVKLARDLDTCFGD